MAKNKGNGAPAKQGGSVAKLRKLFTLPLGLDCSSFVMQELDGIDEIAIAEAMQIKLEEATSGTRDSGLAVMAIRQREEWRHALVEVDGVAVNVDGVPFSAMDKWKQRTIRYVAEAFGIMNGVGAGDLKKFATDARTVAVTSGMRATAAAEEDDGDDEETPDESASAA